jgi:hypothetical protein
MRRAERRGGRRIPEFALERVKFVMKGGVVYKNDYAAR